MSKALLNDTLMRSVGSPMINTDGEFIGKIIEITRDSDKKFIEYVILESGKFFGRGRRVFAIPASSSCIDITDKGMVVSLIPDDTIQFADGVSANDCPKPSFRSNPSVYELYNYQNPETEVSTDCLLNGGSESNRIRI